VSDSAAREGLEHLDPPAQAKYLEGLVKRAMGGDRRASTELCWRLGDNIDVLADYGDLGRRLASELMMRLYENHPLDNEALRVFVEGVRADVAGPNPRLLEQLVAQRVVVALLHVHWVGREYYRLTSPSDEEWLFHERRTTHAQRRYFAAVRCAAQLRAKKFDALLEQLDEREIALGMRIQEIQRICEAQAEEERASARARAARQRAKAAEARERRRRQKAQRPASSEPDAAGGPPAGDADAATGSTGIGA